jgi:hypothetical protein
MERHNDIEKHIEETLNSLEGMHRAEANPFIFTRIQARLSARRNVFDKIIAVAGKPAFALAILFIVLVSNVSVMLQSSTFNSAEQALEQSNQLAVAEEYSNNVPVYDYENPEP